MAEIKKFWVVRDPNDISTLGDIVWETDVNGFARYVLGTGLSQFEHERHTMFASRADAEKEAQARMKKREQTKKAYNYERGS